MIEDFLHLQTLSCEYLSEFSKKFETTLMVYSGAWGNLIHEKNQKSKISWHCPFKCGKDRCVNPNVTLDVEMKVLHVIL